MYSVAVTSEFSAAHQLRNYKGKCENLHGHNWKIQAVLCGNKLDKTGMLIDFTELRKGLESIISVLDHRVLNETEVFKEINPTAENMARWLYNELSLMFKQRGVKVIEVKVWENERSCASYFNP